MNVATQISGKVSSGNKALIAFKSMLAHIGISVTHPYSDESLFYVGVNSAWQRYDQELAFYRAIASSSFHIVHGDEEIDDQTGLQILYAMLKDRPIVVTGTLTLASDLSLFVRDILTKHTHDLHIINLHELGLIELSILFHKLKPTSYNLSRSEKILIAARVRALFRDLACQPDIHTPLENH